MCEAALDVASHPGQRTTDQCSLCCCCTPLTVACASLPCLPRHPHAFTDGQVAIEVVRMCEAALDAAFGLGLPLPRDAVQALLIGMDSVLTR